MPAKKPLKIPAFKVHKASGQGYVYLAGKRVYLGRHDTPMAHEAYRRLIAEWAVHGGQAPVEAEKITIKELLARFWVHAEIYYRRPDGTFTGELDSYRLALRPLKELYGETPAAEFGPRALAAVRQRMIELDWCRSTVNRHLGRIKTVFRWATENEFVGGDVYHALQSVAGLKRGRCAARESEPVRPVAIEYVHAIEQFVSRPIWALVQLQLLTGARAGELVNLRPRDLDTTGRIWTAAPADHKTAHHGHGRTIYFGPRAQDVLRPFLLRPVDAPMFSPQESEAERREKQHAERVTPPGYGNAPGTNRKRHPRRAPGKVYDVAAYRRAIARACDQAFPPPESLAQRRDKSCAAWRARLNDNQKRQLRRWQKEHRWHPHQLRHNAATELRKEFGIEITRVILGHRSPAITELYAEMDRAKAIEAMMRVG